MSKTGYLGVLLRDPFVGVDEDEAHVTAIDGHGGTEDGELLHPVVYLGFFAHTGGVDEDVFAELIFKIAVHCVPGGAGHVADDDPFFPQDTVDQGGLAHVGLADDRHLDDILLLRFLHLVGEILEAGVQHLVHPQAVDGRDGDGVAQTQVIELVHVWVGGANAVGLVHRQHHRLLGAQEQIGHVLVGGGDAGADVAHQDDDVGVVNGDLRLAAHELQNFIVVPGLDAAGVHDGELPAIPVAVGVEPVTGDARGVLHDGQAFACQFIEQHGLAHVGASYDGYHRFCHGLTSSLYHVASRLLLAGGVVLEIFGLFRLRPVLFWRFLGAVHPQHGVQQGEPVLLHKGQRHPQRLFHLLHRHIVQKDILMIAQHGAGQQEPLSQRLVLELGDEVLAGN